MPGIVYQGIKFEHCQQDDIRCITREYCGLVFEMRNVLKVCIDCDTHGSEVGKMLIARAADLETRIQEAATPAEKERLEFLKTMVNKGYDPDADELRTFDDAWLIVKSLKENEPKTT